jgi:nucleotide-binding universal stress UspA family protein
MRFMKKILVPIDGSKMSNMAIDKAKEIALAFNSQVVLLNVMESNVNDYPSNPYKFSPELVSNMKKENRAISEKILEDGKARFMGTSIQVETKLLEGNPADNIVNFAMNDDYDLVIMGSSGLGGLRTILVGSVTRSVVMNLKKPMLIVR